MRFAPSRLASQVHLGDGPEKPQENQQEAED